MAKTAKLGSFTAAEIVAIAGVFKGKAIDEAKSELADGSVCPVDVTVRIQGNVQKAFGTPAMMSHVAATVDLMAAPAIFALLAELGVSSRKLREALANLPNPKFWVEDDGLKAVFDEAALAIAKKLPEVEVESKAKNGACSAAVTGTRV